jgi:2,3-bisphosphoglycerate-independent phosphoglycerate mutase
MNALHPVVLVILDGFGYSAQAAYNAIHVAHKPHLDAWFKKYPHALLQASGTAVGLLPETIGTSEVGHLTIGAGRVIPESIVRLHHAIDDGTFFTNPALVKALTMLKKTTGRLHLMGLLSDAGVHSHEKHLYALIKAAQQAGIKTIFVHAFLDGRDTPPQSATMYLERLASFCTHNPGISIASLHGRFYAMDRDNNWDRTEQSYQILTQPQQQNSSSWHDLIKRAYKKELFDEFIPPVQLNVDGIMQKHDGVIFFNFRADRARQLTRCFVQPRLVPFKPQPPQLTFFLTMTDYDNTLEPDRSYLVDNIIKKEPVIHTLKEMLAAAHKTIFSIAETEKYAHVTYFFGGSREQEFPGEQWVLIPSLKVHNYITYPQMSAHAITKAVLNSLAHSPKDFYLINYPNADMVGHSGNFEATKKAITVLDHELGLLYQKIVHTMKGTLYITADHGNAEQMFDEHTQQPKTSHTTNPVPFLMLRDDLAGKAIKLPLHELADIAPFILKEMGLTVPAEMQR